MASDSPQTPVGIPDPKSIRPYLGLLAMVTLNPVGVAGCNILTNHLPKLSVIRGRKFSIAPSNVSATAKEASRIFEPLMIDNNTPKNFGEIPLSPEDQKFHEKRYWRLPVPPGAILAALFERLQYDSSDSDDINQASILRDSLDLRRLGTYLPNNHGGSDDGPSGGPNGGGSLSKRKDSEGKKNASPRKGKKAARSAVLGHKANCSEFGGVHGESSQCLSDRPRR